MSFTFLAIDGRPWPFDMIVFDMSEFKTNSLIPFLFISHTPSGTCNGLPIHMLKTIFSTTYIYYQKSNFFLFIYFCLTFCNFFLLSITHLILLYDLVTCISIEFLYFSLQRYTSHLFKGFVSSITFHITISLGGSLNFSLTLNITPFLSTNLAI